MVRPLWRIVLCGFHFHFYREFGMDRKRLTLEMQCTCGDSLVAAIRDVKLADVVMQAFARQHTGEGHAPCDLAPSHVHRVPRRSRRRTRIA